MKAHYEVLDDSSGKIPVKAEFDISHVGLENAIQFAKDLNLPFVHKVTGSKTETVWINEPVFYRA